MRLTGLRIGDDPGAWEALGFAVENATTTVGGVAIELAGGGDGLTGWAVDGLDTAVLPAAPSPPPTSDGHPNGAIAVDHVVAVTGDMEATMGALAADGLEARRVRGVPGGDVRQAFYVLETALLELAGPVEGESAPRFWGLTIAVADIDALAEQLGGRLGAIRSAVQPGRRIATLRRAAGSSVPLAFITRR